MSVAEEGGRPRSCCTHGVFVRWKGVVMPHWKCRGGVWVLSLALPVSLAIAAPPEPSAPAPPAPSVSPAPSAASAPETPPTDEELAGVYAGGEGTEIVVCPPGESANWALAVAEPGAQPFTIVLDGDPSSLRPAGLDATIHVGGSPVSVVADGSKLFARGSVDGKDLECLREGGKARMAVGGSFSSKEPASPGQLEMSMTLDDLSARWESIRQARYRLDRSGLQVTDASDPSAPPQSFSRRKALSEDDAKTMEQKLTTRAERLADSKSFAARAEKSEETP